MQFAVKGRLFQVEYQTVVLATLILGWSLYYYFSTVSTPDGGAQSVLFIKPLTILLCICYPFVVSSAIKRFPAQVGSPGRVEESREPDRGFLDPRRIVFAVSMGAYAVAITFFGYLVPSVLFIFFMCFYLGVRNPWILIGLPIGLSIFLSLVFSVFIGVPIPVLPW